MNYKKIHDRIIENARKRIIEDYTEKHHVIPRCLGGSNDKSNIIALLPKEHYVVHHLLMKIHPGHTKLAYAFAMMTVSNSKKHKRTITARQFALAKKVRADASRGKNNPMYGKKSAFKAHTEETKKKMSESAKRRTPRILPKRGTPPEEVRMKIAKANAGQIPWNLGAKDKEYTCPHCGKTGGNSAMKRYHGDKCNKVSWMSG